MRRQKLGGHRRQEVVNLAQCALHAFHSGDEVVAAFAAIGWKWGGEWTNSKDYQHFSATGG